MKKLGTIILLAVATCLPVFAQSPVLEIQSGSDTYWVSNFVLDPNDPSGQTYQLSHNMVETLPNGQKFTLLAADTFIDTDPKVQYGVGVTNGDTATGFTPYTFTFTTSAALTAGLYNVHASLSGSLTDGGSNGSTLEPSAVFPFVQQSLIGGADAGVDLLNTAVNEPTGSNGFTIPDAAGTYNLVSPVTQISIQTNFQLSDNDTATLSGRFDVNAAPEPASIGLGVLAIGAFALLTVLRKQSAN